MAKDSGRVTDAEGVYGPGEMQQCRFLRKVQIKVVGLLEGKRNILQLAFQELEDRLDSLLKVVEEAVTLVFAASEIKDTCFLRTGWPYHMAIESFYLVNTLLS